MCVQDNLYKHAFCVASQLAVVARNRLSYPLLKINP